MRRLIPTQLIWLPAALLALLAIYLPGLDNALVFDDRLLSSGDLFVQYNAFFDLKPRWLSYGSFVWLQDLFGAGWWKHRIGNLIIHAGVVAMLWAFYREILRHVAVSDDGHAAGNAPATYRESPALGVAIGFFALNPVAVYAVAYLIQRSILMATFFVVAALWLFARGLAERRPGYWAAAFCCYILAVLAKEYAIMAPLAALPVFIIVARPSSRRLALIASAGGLLVAVVGTVLALRYGEIIGKPFDEHSHIFLKQLAALGPDVAGNAYPLSILNQAYLFFKYGFLWFLPFGGWMSIDLRPPFPVAWLSFPQALGLLGYLAVLLGGFVLVIRYRDGRSLAGLALLLPALLFVTEFSTVWVQDPFVLYRSYLWAIGAPGLFLFLFHGFPARVVAVIGVLVGALLVWQGLDRVMSMQTPERVWTDAIAKQGNDPRSVGRWFAYLNRAETYLDQNRLWDASQDFKVSSALGDRGIGTYNIGAVLSMVGRFGESLKALDEAERQGYDGFDLSYQRGVALDGLGRTREAHQAFATALEKTHPPAMQARLLAAVGRTALMLGDPASAVSRLESAAALEPENERVGLDLGMAYVSAGQYLRAREVFSGLLQRSPGNGAAYFGRALACHGLKLKTDAQADIESAIRLGPDSAALRDWANKIKAMP